MDLETLRDLVIVIYGIVWIVLSLVLLIIAVAAFFIIRRIYRLLRELVNDPIRPALNEVQRTAENVRGASEFMVDQAVHPFIRGLAMARGARRGMRTLVGFRSRLRR